MSLLPSTFRPLHDGWRLTAVSGPVPDSLKRALAGRIPATVPGEAHLDLLAAGLIADPFDGDNEAAQQWIGDTTWRYETTFEWIPAGEPAETTRMRHDLLACGLDTVAAVELNGHLVGRTQNQHRSYRWDVRPYLREGTNNLAVTFAAPVPEAKRRADTFGALPRVNHHEYNQLRKMACSFGWDWGIDVAGAGIWKPLGLDSWAGARIASVRPLVDVEGADGILRCHIEIERATENDIPVTLTLTPPQVGSTSSTTAPLATSAIIPAGKNSTTIEVRVPNVALWWPRGHGAQSRYELTISLLAATTWRGRIGFRTVTVDTTADEQGAPFNVIVNGKLIAIRGANWIPDHAFLTRITRERYARGISDAVAANMNLLRVWGGGSYELAEFYDLADEAGLLIWQDFPFACAAYPEDDDTAAEIEAEAREHIVRLSPHPSLIIWCGNNENTWGFVDWGWGGTLAGRGWGDRYYSDLLPSLLAELDPTRFYTPASPYSFGDYRHPNDFRYGLSHSWEPWNRLPYGEYRNISARFISEFGWQGPPAWATLISVVHDEPLNPFGQQMLVHQKANLGNLKLQRGWQGHLPDPRSIEDWHWTCGLNQAAAVRFGIEHWRSLAPLNSGVVVWQLNDNWPVVSWAAVDHHGRRKPLWHAIRQAFAPRLATLQPRSSPRAIDAAWEGMAPERDVVRLVLVNDTDKCFTGNFAVKRQVFDGITLAAATVAVDLPPRSTREYDLPAEVYTFTDPAAEYLHAAPISSFCASDRESQNPDQTVTINTGSCDSARFAPSTQDDVKAAPLPPSTQDDVKAAPLPPSTQDDQVAVPIEDRNDFAPAFWNGAEVVTQRLDPQAVTAVGRKVPGGYEVTATAASYARDLFLHVDKVDPAASVDIGMFTLIAGESATFRIASALDVDPATFAATLRTANDLLGTSSFCAIDSESQNLDQTVTVNSGSCDSAQDDVKKERPNP